MEDILASIRRIIADDQETAKAPAPAMDEPDDIDDDVLDLAEVAKPVAKAPDLDLDHEEISFRDEDPGQIDFDAIDIDDDFDAEAEVADAEPEPEPDPEPVAFAPPPPPQPRLFDEERLISSATDSSVSQAFNMLAHTVLTNNARTLEDLVREMLKPMLKVWLDDNLPSIVERLVRAEIERVSRGGR